MKMILEKEQYLKSTIRDIMAVNPMVSIRSLQEMVESNTGRSISDKYVSKLMCKIRKEAIVQSDRKKMNERLAEVRERYRVLMEHPSRIIYWKKGVLPTELREQVIGVFRTWKLQSPSQLTTLQT